MGLAIPVDKVVRVVPVLIARVASRIHGWASKSGYEITPRLAQMLRLPVQNGLLIAQFYRGSPADQAGVRGAQDEAIMGNRRYLVGGDIVTTVDDMPLQKSEDLRSFWRRRRSWAKRFRLTWCETAKNSTFNVTLADTPESVPSR